jgi:hypothetical protein
MLRTINNTIRTLLIHAFMPSAYWVEALSIATFLINRLPSTKTPNTTPFQLLHHKPPTYSDLRVFGCLCYPNTSATTTHKLSPRSVPCAFLGYPSSHKGYRCLNLVTQKLIISHHVIFDETVFPFRFRYPNGHGTSMDFLLPPASSPLMAQGAGMGDTPSPSDISTTQPEDDAFALAPTLRGAWSSPAARPYGLSAQDSSTSSTSTPSSTSAPEPDPVHGPVHEHGPARKLLPLRILPKHRVCCMGLFQCMAMCPTLLRARSPGAAAPLLQFITPSPYCVMRATLTRWSRGDRPVSPSSLLNGSTSPPRQAPCSHPYRLIIAVLWLTLTGVLLCTKNSRLSLITALGHSSLAPPPPPGCQCCVRQMGFQAQVSFRWYSLTL